MCFQHIKSIIRCLLWKQTRKTSELGMSDYGVQGMVQLIVLVSFVDVSLKSGNWFTCYRQIKLFSYSSVQYHIAVN